MFTLIFSICGFLLPRFAIRVSAETHISNRNHHTFSTKSSKNPGPAARKLSSVVLFQSSEKHHPDRISRAGENFLDRLSHPPFNENPVDIARKIF